MVPAIPAAALAAMIRLKVSGWVNACRMFTREGMGSFHSPARRPKAAPSAAVRQVMATPSVWVPKIMSSASELGFLLRTVLGEQQPR